MSQSKRMVKSEAVERACSEVGAYSEQQLSHEFERFFKVQPDLCEFVIELTGDSDLKTQELSLFLSYMVFKSVEQSGAGEPHTVTQDSIEQALHDSEAWIEKVNRLAADEIQSSILSNLTTGSEPHLLQYVLLEIDRPLDDGTRLTDEQKGEVFFILKTVISMLSGKSFETESTE